MEKVLDRTLKSVYYNTKRSGSFGGVKPLTDNVKPNSKRVKKWLSFQDTYTLHKPIRRKFSRRKTIVAGIGEQYQADLIDVRHLKRENDNFNYILTCIDVFSKVAFAIPLKNKTSASIIQAFKDIFSLRDKPRVIQTDKGSEFTNSIVQNYFRNLGVRHFVSENDDIKASIVERFNRTLKERLWRYFTYRNSRRYLEVLPDLVDSYNNTYHRSIKLKPSEVNYQNQEQVWQRLYGQPSSTKQKSQVGDRVRVSATKVQFSKGYLPSWSEELFTISRTLRTSPITYVLKDDNGEELKGSFYQQELQKVGEKSLYRIETVLRTRRGSRGRKEVLVKWWGYPESFNSWIPQHQLQRYRDGTG